MKTNHTLSLLTLAALGALCAAPVFAQDSYYYGGLSFGKARTSVDAARVAESVSAPGTVFGDINRDPKDAAYSIFAGYQFNRTWGLELAYFDLGQFGFDAPTVPAGNVNGQLRFQGGSLDLVGALPLTENLSLLGRLGGQMARTRDRFTGTGAAVVTNSTPSQREVDVKVGAGLQYAFSPSFLMRGEVTRFRINDAVGNHPNVNVYGVSLVFPFGRTASPAPRAQAPSPAYVAAAPAPMPEPVVVAPAPAPMAMAAPEPVVAPIDRRRVSYSAESMFGFDRAALTTEGKAALDTFATELGGTQFDTINVEGHTDRLGTEAYNQKLSQQRADAVKEYLVSTGKVDPAKIVTTGKSESSPVTKAEDCKGNAATAKLIACLAPDRRVEIEVAGTR
jgi:OOP family OmpA-OmpF porin